MKNLVFVAFGAGFGFCLSRADATSIEAISGMFRLTDLHLFGVIGVAIATAAALLFALRRAGLVAPIPAKPMSRSVFTGGLVFGAGWAIAGSCPGTALAQLGEGKLYALATVLGILAGTWTWRRVSMQSARSAAPSRTAPAA